MGRIALITTQEFVKKIEAITIVKLFHLIFERQKSTHSLDLNAYF